MWQGLGICSRVWGHIAGGGGMSQGVGSCGRDGDMPQGLGAYGRGRGGDIWQGVGACGKHQKVKDVDYG